MHPGIPLAYAARHIYAPNEDPYRASKAILEAAPAAAPLGGVPAARAPAARALPSPHGRGRLARTRHVPREVASRGRCGTS